MTTVVQRLGFVVKRYPRYSETFFVREILAHEAAGVEVFIYSLQPSEDAHFQDSIARVRAPVCYLRTPRDEFRRELERRRGHTPSVSSVTMEDLWLAVELAAKVNEGMWQRLESAKGERAELVYSALVLALEVGLKGIQHLHAGFSNTPATVARLAAGFAGITYSCTARAKDIFHLKTVRPDELIRNLGEATAAV